MLTLVYNPVGPRLPPSQQELEAAYRRELKQNYGLEFSRLFAITNMPISRFLEHLVATGQFETYMQTLIDSFNVESTAHLMCRNTLSVGWDGRLYDCDFNQMLELEIESSEPPNITNVDVEHLMGRPIVTGQHCYGCTAGSGSGCQGAITL